jgi:hypothetical protein
MGRNNQQRRAEKKRREERRQRDAGRPLGSWRTTTEELQALRVQSLMFRGAEAAAHGAGAEAREDVVAVAEALASCARSMSSRSVTALMGGEFSSLLAQKWVEGWQPVELARMARMARRASSRHAKLVASAMSAAECWRDAGGVAMPDAWVTQLAVLGCPPVGRPGRDWLGTWMAADDTRDRPLVDVLVVVLEVLGVLIGLPAIEPLIPRPSEWGKRDAGAGRDAGDDPVLVKVRALLAKAESTGFEAESEALTAKAQELMARHAIDGAVARARSSRREMPVTRRIAVDSPYATAKSQLLAIVARSNDVRCVLYEKLEMMAVVGFAADLDAVEVLFTSLLVQASKAMLAKGKVIDGRGQSRTRSFRQSFIVAFAVRIGERLTIAAAAARKQAEEETVTSLAPVLASRAKEIEDEVARVFPHTRPLSGLSATNVDGWRAGRIAAGLATLGPLQGMLDGMAVAG